MSEMKPNIPAFRELIAHLEGQPPERFNMGYVFRTHEGDFSLIVPEHEHQCGTAACIAGHCAYIAKAKPGIIWGGESAQDFLGLNFSQNLDLFCPDEWKNDREGNQRYPLSRAIATLKRLVAHYEATGEVVVDWGPEPGDEPKQPWSAPVVSVRKLPDCLTIALDAPAPSLVREGV